MGQEIRDIIIFIIKIQSEILKSNLNHIVRSYAACHHQTCLPLISGNKRRLMEQCIGCGTAL